MALEWYMGLEPMKSAWKAEVLPLHQYHILAMTSRQVYLVTSISDVVVAGGLNDMHMLLHAI